jgi:sugar-specific transcriptional regulator TrmB
MADLRDLGLSEYEAAVYRALLDAGATTAKELSEASDVPMGRIYDVLGLLEEKDIVRSQTAGRPKKYVAVEPETALDRLFADRKRELEAQIDQYEESVAELKRSLDAPAESEGFWTAALGPEPSAELFVERIRSARESVVMITGPVTGALDIGRLGVEVVDAVEDAAERGVTVSILVDEELLGRAPESLLARFQEGVGADEDVSLRVSDGMTGSFSVIDGSEVCIEVPHPTNPDEAFALIDLQDRTLAAEVRAEFEPRWEEAEPL